MLDVTIKFHPRHKTKESVLFLSNYPDLKLLYDDDLVEMTLLRLMIIVNLLLMCYLKILKKVKLNKLLKSIIVNQRVRNLSLITVNHLRNFKI